MNQSVLEDIATLLVMLHGQYFGTYQWRRPAKLGTNGTKRVSAAERARTERGLRRHSGHHTPRSHYTNTITSRRCLN